jgi:uncharacterized protein (TIGR02246 family)
MKLTIAHSGGSTKDHITFEVKLMFKRILTTTLLLAAATAQAATPGFDSQELANRWTTAYNEHNPAKLAELYDENAVVMLHGTLTLKGREAIHDYWVEDFRESNPITTLDVSHTIEGVDMVLVHGNYQVVDRNDGALLGKGRYAHIWLLDENGNWELDRDLWYEPVDPY